MSTESVIKNNENLILNKYENNWINLKSFLFMQLKINVVIVYSLKTIVSNKK